MTIQIDQNYLTSTLVDLVQIDSTNPSLVPGGAGENQIAKYTARALKQLGLEVSVLESVPGRPSVVGLLPGSGGRSLMFNAHYDTVGKGDMVEPFSGDVNRGRLFGRGAYDMKAGLAASMAAVKALIDLGISLPGDLIIAAVADEEYASIGTLEVIDHFPTEAAIVTEPTQLNICLAHKGFIWLNVDVYGQAAHGSRYDLGLDANMRMGRILTELEKLAQSLLSQKGHSLLGPPSLHAAVLNGGTELSAYAAHSRLQIERRTIPGESEEMVLAEIQTILNQLKNADETFSATVSSFFVRDPFEASENSEIVDAVTTAATQVLGAEPEKIGEMPWMDSALLAAAGIDTVVIGPSGAGAHADEEWVDVDSAASLAHILASTAIVYGNRQ